MRPMDELSVEKSNYSLRIKCKQAEIKEYLSDITQAVGPNVVAVLDQKIHDIAYLATQEALLAGELRFRQKLADIAAKASEASANEETAPIIEETPAQPQE